MSMMINPAGGDRTVAAGKPFTLRMPRKKPAADPEPPREAEPDPDDTEPAATDDTGDESGHAEDESGD